MTKTFYGAGLTEKDRGLFDERAGILELDGGLSKAKAEREALKFLLRMTRGERNE